MKLIIILLFTYLIYLFIKRMKVGVFQKPKISTVKDVSMSKKDSTSKAAKWYGPGESIHVHGYKLEGLVYVGEVLLGVDEYSNDACLINPRLKVEPAEIWEIDEEIGYWPSYNQISEKCRGGYLKWLANDRANPRANIGYVFLFFYGLERRVFVDSQENPIPELERCEIIKEVNRLIEIYGSNNSFLGYAKNFLATEWVFYQREKPVPNYIDFNNRHCLQPFQVVLAQFVGAGKPVPAEIILQWIFLQVDYRLGTPARRCAKEFRDLFIIRFHQQFPEGMVIKPNKTILQVEYYPASPSLPRNIKLKFSNLPDPFILSSPLKKPLLLAEQCLMELDSFSRYIGRQNNNPSSVVGLSLLPKELMEKNQEIIKVKKFLADSCNEGPAFITLEKLYTCLEKMLPEQFSRKESEKISNIIEKLGFCLIPDIRTYNIGLKLGEPVVIFENNNESDFPPSSEFQKILMILRLGAIVSQSDHHVSSSEEKALQGFIRNNNKLNGLEKSHLAVFLKWCLKVPQEATGFKKRLSELPVIEKTAISRFLVSIAQSDGSLDPREIKKLEKLYTILGLSNEKVIDDIHDSSVIHAPVTMSLREHEIVFSISKCVENKNALPNFNLNEGLIKLREDETRQVRNVLQTVFSEQADDITEETHKQCETRLNSLAGLDQAHQSLLKQLLQQETWDRLTLYNLCKKSGLMLDGALEIINEWAFKHANAPLIEDGEPVYVDVNLAREIMND